MKVEEVMTRDVRSCSPAASLAQAAELFWAGDCGMVPVVDDGRLIGVITDRDICIALGTRDGKASEIPVRDVARGEVTTCPPDASVEAAMAAMRRSKIRRLPVVKDGRVVGVVSLNDLILAAHNRLGPVDYEDLLSTLRAVSEHRSRQAGGERKPTFPAIPVVAV